jgi:hypothetical protein
VAGADGRLSVAERNGDGGRSSLIAGCVNDDDAVAGGGTAAGARDDCAA